MRMRCAHSDCGILGKLSAAGRASETGSRSLQTRRRLLRSVLRRSSTEHGRSRWAYRTLNRLAYRRVGSAGQSSGAGADPRSRRTDSLRSERNASESLPTVDQNSQE